MPKRPISIMTVEDVAAYLRVHQSTLYRLLKNGNIPGFKIGSDWRFNRETIDEWMKERESEFLSEKAAPEKPRRRAAKRKSPRKKSSLRAYS
jgi:excisionase family DNA binding protein